jgi:hypothetical protein
LPSKVFLKVLDGKLELYKKSVKFQNQQILNYIQRKKHCIQEYQRKKRETIKFRDQVPTLLKAIDNEKQLIRKIREDVSPASPGVLNISSLKSGSAKSRYSSVGSNNSMFKSLSNHANMSQSSSVHRSATSRGSSSTEFRNLKGELFKQMMRAKIQRAVRSVRIT